MHQLFCLKEKLLSRMNFNLRERRKSKLFVIASFAFAFFIYVLIDLCNPFTVNHTPSCPRGIYMHVPYHTLAPNDYVTVYCPETHAPLVEKGHVLLKRVKALPGDTYELKDDAMIIRNEVFPVYHLKYLPQLVDGEYTVPQGYYLFLNDMRYSFDSRYIGPISKENILHKEILLINYDFFNAMYQKWIGGKADETYTFSNYFSHM